LDLSFGQFRLDTKRKMLWRGPEYLPLGARAYAILFALVETPGRVVPKSELFERAWPGLSVDGANLRVQIASLRRLLGETGAEIVTEQSLGYSFTGDVRRVAEPSSQSAVRRFHPPVVLQRPLGRDRESASVIEALQSHRLATIVGPGGIGKTTLALQVASDVRYTGNYNGYSCNV
jgi:DNA-binding winged helix-turn-helix (wHTH) protein